MSRAVLEHTRAALAADAWPQSPPSKHEVVAAQLLASMREYVTGALATSTADADDPLRRGGTRPKAAQQGLHTLAAAVYSEDVVKERNVSTATDLTGITRKMYDQGRELRARNMDGEAAVSIGGERAVRRDAVDLEFLYDYFHDQSPHVEPDKSVKWNYKKKKIVCAGKERMITCRPRVLTSSVAEAVEEAMKSDVYVRSGVQLHPKTVAACICHCIKPVKREECACPTCTEFVEALTAYHRKRHLWHAEDGATCDGACGLECKNSSSLFRTFTRNYSIFEQNLRCPKRARPEVRLPHEEHDPEFYQLRCCLKRRRDGAGNPTGLHEPRFTQACTACAPKRARLLQAPGQPRCADEHNGQPVTWKKYKDVLLEDGKTANKLVEHRGTRAELLTQIERTAQVRSFAECRMPLTRRTCAGVELPSIREGLAKAHVAAQRRDV